MRKLIVGVFMIFGFLVGVPFKAFASGFSSAGNYVEAVVTETVNGP